MTKYAYSLLSLLLVAASPATAKMITITPAQIGEIFCIGSQGNDMAPVEALLSPDLSLVIANAWARNAGFIENAPNGKPPLGDGLPWRTMPDYADSCAVTASSIEADSATVVIDYVFNDYPDASYSNELLLVPVEIMPGQPPFWRIDDIDLNDGQTMRGALLTAFDSYQ